MKPRILYIVGSGRNGSTVLANILGSAGGAVSVGELFYIWERGFRQNRLCGCGERFLDCPFWREVRERAEIDSLVAVDTARLVGEIARTRHAFMPVNDAAQARLLETLAGLYTAIRDVSGADVIIDSSKVPVYGRLVERIPSFEFVPLLLVRDPRAVAFSWMRKKPQPDKPGTPFMTRHNSFQSAMMWLTWNGLALRFWENRLIIRYEEFAADPVGVIEGICAYARFPAPAPQSDGSFEVRQSHTVSGNPLRFSSGPITIQLDEEWRTAMAPLPKAVVVGLTLPLLLRFGYGIRAE